MNYWQGEKICLRAIEPSDWEVFFKWDIYSERSKYLHFLCPPASQESLKSWVLEKSKKRLENDTFFWVITDLERNAVGSIDTHDCDHRLGSFSYGIDIAPEYRRKGYATEAIQLVLKYYFEELRYQKVTVNVHSNNPPSISLHEKLGFKKEGVLRRMVYTEGKYYDMIWFGMTREEFNEVHLRPQQLFKKDS